MTEKKAAAPKAPAKRAKPKESETLYSMPQDVKDWIERAQSIMAHQRGEIDRLKAEVKELKAYKGWAANRILRSEHES